MGSGSLGVALTPQPTDTPITIHPIIDIGLAVKARDFPGLGARVLGYDSPIIFRLSDRSEGHFCFCHETLCNRSAQKTNTSPRTSCSVVLFWHRRPASRFVGKATLFPSTLEPVIDGRQPIGGALHRLCPNAEHSGRFSAIAGWLRLISKCPST